MNTTTSLPVGQEIVYPDSDGQPMAENTLQFQWIVTIQGNLDAMFADDPNVFVAGDLLWYPVEGSNTIRTAPDALVVFGRKKGYRGSYMQWREGNIPPQVVWEILSPGNRPGELQEKLEFYQRHGVEEYCQYDPDRVILRVWLRSGNRLAEQDVSSGWKSPRLGIRMQIKDGELEIHRPDGRKFKTFLEIQRSLENVEKQMAGAKNQIANAQRQAAAAQEKAAAAQEQAERLAKQLRDLGIEPQEMK